ncbi:MAG: HD domain-containing phosphohydrolase [candidate division Zixibacteria bacterium]
MANKFMHTILVVDDEEGVLKSLRRLLKSPKVKVITATSGREAIEHLKNNNISLIISDQRMPEMTGVQFLNKARDISPETIRILLTGYADIDATIEAINDGAVRYYFNKPWDNDIFTSRISESLEQFRITAENNRLKILTEQQKEILSKMNETLEQKVSDQVHQIKIQHKELHRSFMDTIKAISSICELRFKEVGSHSQRVAAMAKEFLNLLKINKKEYQDIIVAALLHDIGKVAIPDEIIDKKPIHYTDRDKEILMTHSVLGQSCLCGIKGFEEISIIVRHHHENYDGGGSPDSIRGDGIPLGARIIRIADAFDRVAFVSGYPDMKRLNSATAHLLEYTGSKYCPDLLRLFIENNICKIYFQDDYADEYMVKPGDLKQGMVIAGDVHTKSGLFVIPKGARLSSGMIKRIIKMDKCDPITKGIKIIKQINHEDNHEIPQHIIG